MARHGFPRRRKLIDGRRDVVDDAGAVETEQDCGDTPQRGTDVSARPGLAAVAALCVTGLVALAGVGGWLGYRIQDEQREQAMRNAFIDAARTGARNLTTIDHTTVDDDIKRILDSSTGAFHDDFGQRSGPFATVVREAQSKSTGTITSAGLATLEGVRGEVLVAVTVQTSSAVAAEQEPRLWRMRIAVEKVDERYLVEQVEFVP